MRLHRQTVPFSAYAAARGRRQGGGGRLGPCTRLDGGAAMEEGDRRAAHRLRTVYRVYTLRPPPPYAPDKRGLPPTLYMHRARPPLRFGQGSAPFRRSYAAPPGATAPARCARHLVAQIGGRGTPAALRYATGRLRAPASKERITRPRVPPPPCRLVASSREDDVSLFRRGLRIPALVDGKPSTSPGTRYAADIPGGDRLTRSVLLGSALSLMPRRARVRSLFPPRYEPSRCASCARIVSDCLRVLLALVRVSVPLVDRTAPLVCPRRHRHGAHPCAGKARITLATWYGTPPAGQNTRDGGTVSRRLRPACGGFGLDAAPPPAFMTDKGARVSKF